MKLGIFGGSFNPPHQMHYMLVKQLLEKIELDKIIVIPTGSTYPKDGLIPAHHRLQMLELLFQDVPNVIISDYERKDQVTYTYQTLAYFQQQYPEATLYFICGSDNLRELYWWERHDEMLKNYHFIVIPRNGDQIAELEQLYPEYQDHIHFVKLPLIAISSTEVRQKIKAGLAPVSELNPAVWKYIQKHHFYRE